MDSSAVHVAVVGAGPSGFYTVEALLKQDAFPVRVDLYDRLPTPFGLVRYGVAPDHQNIKAVTKVYDKLAQDERVRFCGNVHVGRDASVDELRAHYDYVVFCVGCERARALGIPGEDLEGSYSATEFVAWYNGHPDYVDANFDLSHERVAVVGVGNVAMDVTRTLVRNRDELAATDMADYAVDALRRAGVREVLVLGRRGPAQAAFSPKEIQEIGELSGVDLLVEREEVEPYLAVLDQLEREAKKNVAYLGERLAAGPSGAERRVRLRFLVSPVELIGKDGHVAAVKLERNQLVGDAQGKVRVQGTGKFETIEVGAVFRAIGYFGSAIPGLPFDPRSGLVPSHAGRVTGDDGEPAPGLYVAGWIKRGPSGLIGTNKADAVATVSSLLADHERGKTGLRRYDPDVLLATIAARGVRVISYADWRRLDALELERGAAAGKVRQKFTRLEDMLAALDRIQT